MPNRPIIDIDVNSEAFTKFKAAFDAYADRVEETNKAWSTGKVFGDAAALKPLSDYAEGMAKSLHRMQGALHTAGHGLSSFAHTAKGALHTVESITKNFAKWSAILAGGTLFGLDRLAGSAFERGRSAAGIGVSIGQQSAFGINMSRYVDNPSGLLAKAADIQQDRSKSGILAGMGLINDPNVRTESPMVLAEQFARKGAEFWRQTPDLQLAKARGFLDVFSPEELRRLGAAGPEGIDKAAAKIRHDATSLGFGPQVADEWSALSIQLHLAGKAIETSLITGLAPLAPELDKLSDAAVKMTDAFFKSPDVKAGIDDLAHGLDWLADKMQSPEFKKAIGDFVDDLKLAGSDIVQVAQWTEKELKWLGIIKPSGGTGDAPAATGGFWSTIKDAFNGLAGVDKAPANSPTRSWDSIWHATTRMFSGGAAPESSDITPHDPLGLIEKYESGGRNILNAHFDATHTAGGYWQITDTNWRHLAPGLGIDIAKYPTAITAPKAWQRVVAQAMRDADLKRGGTGYGDWAPYNKFLRAALARGEGNFGKGAAAAALPAVSAQAPASSAAAAAPAFGAKPVSSAPAKGIPVMTPKGIVVMTDAEYQRYTANQGSLPPLPTIGDAKQGYGYDYIFGTKIPRPATDAAGHILMHHPAVAKLRTQFGPAANSNGSAPALAAGGGLAEAFQREFRALRQDIRKHAVKLDVHNSTAAQVAISAANLAPK